MDDSTNQSEQQTPRQFYLERAWTYGIPEGRLCSSSVWAGGRTGLSQYSEPNKKGLYLMFETTPEFYFNIHVLRPGKCPSGEELFKVGYIYGFGISDGNIHGYHSLNNFASISVKDNKIVKNNIQGHPDIEVPRELFELDRDFHEAVDWMLMLYAEDAFRIVKVE